MVGFIAEPSANAVEEPTEDSKFKALKDLVEPLDPKLPNLSFADSFLDFDAIEGYFEDNPDSEKPGFWDFEVGAMDAGDVRDPFFDGCVPRLEIEGGSGCAVKEESVNLEEEMGRVNLVDGSNSGIVEASSGKLESNSGGLVVSNGGGENGGVTKDEDDSESGSDEDSGENSSSSSSSSSDSSDDDDDDDDDEEESDGDQEGQGGAAEEKREADELGDMEEGEIRDPSGEGIVGGTSNEESDEEDEEDAEEMVEWTDVELGGSDEEDEEGVGAVEEPIRSKNEVKELPPVPPIHVSLQPHHQVMPVGVVLSIVGPQVIVEGVEKHNPLNEGSILWITEKRCPLGLVDEIFGPVKNPYYLVRYNSESEVPDGIHNGTLVSFVPDFASHVLNDKNLYTKGYDASGEHDEEVFNETEFSDDEKEAEYKRMLKMSKRGMNDQAGGKKKNNRKKINNRDGNWKNNKPPGQQTPVDTRQLPANQDQHNVSPIGASMGHYHLSSSSAMGQDLNSAAGSVQAFPPMPQAAGVPRPSSGLWANGLAPPQTHNGVQGGFPANNMLWSAQSQQFPYQMPIISSMPLQQQINPSQGLQPNAALPGGQPNLSAFPFWPNPPGFGMGFQVPAGQSTLPINFGGQGMMANNLQPPTAMQGDQQNVGGGNQGMMVNNLRPPAVMPGHQLFNMGMGNQGMVANNLQQPIGMPHQQFSAGAGDQRMLANNLQPPAAVPGHQQFNMGAPSGRGRKPHHRGGHHRGGGRGWQPRS